MYLLKEIGVILVRRSMDVVLAGLLFVPVMLVVMLIAAVMLIVNGRPVFFLAQRIGRGGRVFSCIKMRTITDYAGRMTTLDFRAQTDANLLPLGRFLRNRGLDELPQLINILRGEMSFVGPRPLIPRSYERIRQCNPDCLDLVEHWESWRLQVVPGLSGWHQIHTACTDMIRYDLEYLEDPSLARQFRVFVNSVLILLVGKQRYFGWGTVSYPSEKVAR